MSSPMHVNGTESHFLFHDKENEEISRVSGTF